MDKGGGLLMTHGIGDGARDLTKKIPEVGLKRGVGVNLVDKGLPGRVTLEGPTALSGI